MPSNRSQESSVIIIELLIMVNTIRREQIHDQKWQCSTCLTVFRFNWKRCSMFRWKICIECPYIVSFVLFSLLFSLVRLHLCPVISFFFFFFLLWSSFVISLHRVKSDSLRKNKCLLRIFALRFFFLLFLSLVRLRYSSSSVFVEFSLTWLIFTRFCLKNSSCFQTFNKKTSSVQFSSM